MAVELATLRSHSVPDIIDLQKVQDQLLREHGPRSILFCLSHFRINESNAEIRKMQQDNKVITVDGKALAASPEDEVNLEYHAANIVFLAAFKTLEKAMIYDSFHMGDYVFFANNGFRETGIVWEDSEKSESEPLTPAQYRGLSVSYRLDKTGGKLFTEDVEILPSSLRESLEARRDSGIVPNTYLDSIQRLVLPNWTLHASTVLGIEEVFNPSSPIDVFTA